MYVVILVVKNFRGKRLLKSMPKLKNEAIFRFKVKGIYNNNDGFQEDFKIEEQFLFMSFDRLKPDLNKI